MKQFVPHLDLSNEKSFRKIPRKGLAAVSVTSGKNGNRQALSAADPNACVPLAPTYLHDLYCMPCGTYSGFAGSATSSSSSGPRQNPRDARQTGDGDENEEQAEKDKENKTQKETKTETENETKEEKERERERERMRGRHQQGWGAQRRCGR